jgi:PST family polysaccharide transporter
MALDDGFLRQSMSKHSFGSAVTWNLIGSVARILITLVCQIALLRLLGPLPAGQFAIFLFIVGVGSILSEGGMMVALARAPTLDERLVRGALFLILCYSSVAALVLLAFTGPFMRLFQLPAAESYVPVIAALNVIPLGLSSVPISLLKQQYRSRDLQVIQLSAYVLGFAVVGLPLALFYKSVVVLVAAFTTQTTVTLIAGMIISRCPIVPHWRGASAIRGVSARALTVNIASYVNESSANVLTAHFLGPTAVGLYSTTYNLLRMPTDVVVSALHAPLLVSTAQDDGGAGSRDRFLSTLNVLATTVLAVFVVSFLCGPQFIRVLLGDKWIDAGPVLSVVALIMAGRLISMLSGAVVWGRGRLTIDLTAQILGMVVMLGGFLLLRPADVVPVAWIVFASLAIRVTIQLGAAMRACAITFGQMLHALVLPAIVTTIVMLPMQWVAPIVPRYGMAGFLVFGVIAALLLAVRVALSFFRSPYAWTALVRTRLNKVRAREVPAEAAQRIVSNPAEPDRPALSIPDVP